MATDYPADAEHQDYRGFRLHCWAETVDEGFRPRMLISQYHDNRKETLRKSFAAEELCRSKPEACTRARALALEIVDGMHPQMTIDDITLP